MSKTIKEKVLLDQSFKRSIESANEEDRENITNTIMHVVSKFEEVEKFLQEILEDPEKAAIMREMLIEAVNKSK